MVKALEVGRGGWIIWVCNPRVLVREAGREIRVRERERERAQKGTLLVLKREGGTPSQELQAGSGSWQTRAAAGVSPRVSTSSAALPAALEDPTPAALRAPGLGWFAAAARGR